jgi:hypothetical protein
MESGSLGLAVFVAVFVKAALDRVAALIRAKWPEADLTLPFGVLAIVLGGGLAWLAGVNVFEGLALEPTLGRVLTAIAVGLGVEFLNDILATVQGRSGTDVTVRGIAAEAAEPRSAATIIGMEPDEPAETPLMLFVPRVRGW